MTDATETDRKRLMNEINAESAGRDALSTEHGQVWNTTELTSEYEVLGFMAPYVVVRRKQDSCKGSLEFQHSPRLYFNFAADNA
jgi:hypothetical protein